MSINIYFVKPYNIPIVFKVKKFKGKKWRECSIMITSLNNLDYLLNNTKPRTRKQHTVRRGQENITKYAPEDKISSVVLRRGADSHLYHDRSSFRGSGWYEPEDHKIRPFFFHYENTPIQIYRKLYLQKPKLFR